MEISKEQKEAIEYLKTRLHGNEGCKYIDVSQDDLRIFINLVDEQIKDNEGWKKYCEEIEEEQTEMSNKNCELEFEVEKLQKENEKYKRLSEMNLKNAEEFKNNMCEHRCLLKSENEELKKFITEGITVAPHSPYKNYRLDFLRENFVSKKKIKDKIEELNQYYKKEIYPILYQWCDITITEHYDEMIELLQEIIGDK